MGQHKFKNQIFSSFNLSDIKSICFDLGLNYDELPGDRLSRKIESLLVAVYRADRFKDLINQLNYLRPKVEWPLVEDVINFNWGTLSEEVEFPVSIQNWIKSIGNVGDGSNIIQGDRSSINIDNRIIYQGIQNIEQLYPADGESPYKGLQKFDEEDAEWFFGREQLASTIMQRLHRASFLIVIGASGSGKTSVVRAGVLPYLRLGKTLPDGTVPPLGKWEIYKLTPTANPLEKLASSIFPNKDDRRIQFLEQINESNFALQKQIYEFVEEKQGLNTLLLIDQFEEIFTLTKDDSVREKFINNLIEASENDQCTIIITLRSDFYSDCLEYKKLRTLLKTAQEPIGQMTKQELENVILRPAKKGGWRFQVGLPEEMLEDVISQPGGLPLLSHALLETWKRRRGRVLTLSGYREAGSIKGAIAETANDLFDNSNEEEKEIIKSVFLELTNVSSDAPDTKKRIRKSELVEKFADLSIFNVLNKLTDSDVRLLVSGIENGEETLEVAHEALIREWPRLRDWLDEDRIFRIWKTRFNEDINQWEKYEKNEAALLFGKALKEAQDFLQERPQDLNSLEKLFIETSVQKFNEDESNRLRLEQKANRRLKGLVAFLASVTIALSLYLATPFFLSLIAIGEMVLIPSGEFLMGSSDLNVNLVRTLWPNEPVPLSHEQPQHPVFIDEFRINQHEITVKQYRYCILARVCRPHPDIEGSLFNSSIDNLPISKINWFEAVAFCEWIGGRLPTEAEWEKSAKFETVNLYPWGSDWNKNKANVLLDENSLDVSQDNRSEVGRYSSNGGDTNLGLSDMSGNVWEWVSDWYSSDYYAQPNIFENPTGPMAGERRVIRGGSFQYRPVDARTTTRFQFPPGSLSIDIGFRCVVSYSDK